MSLKNARNEAKRLMLSGSTEVASGVPLVSYRDVVDQCLQVKAVELRPTTMRDYQRILKRFEFSGTVDDIRPFCRAGSERLDTTAHK